MLYTQKATPDKETKSKGSIRIKHTFEQYLNHPNRPATGISTLEKNYRRIWNKFAKTLKYDFLEEITEQDAIRYAQSLIEQGFSEATYNYHTGTLRLIYKTLLPKKENPFNSLKRKKVNSTKHKILSDSDLDRVLKVTEGEMRILFMVGIYTGLRLSDAVFLCYEHICNDLIKLKPLKTQRHGTEVNIPVHHQLKAVLELNAGKTGYIMPELASLTHDALSGRVQACFKRAGFETAAEVEGRKRKACIYGFHSLRHTFVSRLANAGVSLAIIGRMAGHTSERMTAHYYDANEDTLRNAISSI